MSDPLEQAVEIGDGRARALVLPSVGGGLGRFDMAFDMAQDGDWRPVMRPFVPPADGTPPAFAAALNPLVPWSNRLSRGIVLDGERHDIAPNLDGEPYPIHGDGWLARWTVAASSAQEARLAHDGAIGPYRYAAELVYRIVDGALTVRLAARNVGERTLPYGLGLHPWFVRDRETRLQAPAKAMWLEGEGHLPTERVALNDGRAFDTTALTPLPDAWINAGYDGWRGHATLRWADGAGVAIEALPGDGARLDRFVLYSPAVDAPFVCFEPVTHAIDAPNLEGGPLAHGMVAVAPGASIAITCRFTPFIGDTP